MKPSGPELFFLGSPAFEWGHWLSSVVRWVCWLCSVIRWDLRLAFTAGLLGTSYYTPGQIGLPAWLHRWAELIAGVSGQVGLLAGIWCPTEICALVSVSPTLLIVSSWFPVVLTWPIPPVFPMRWNQSVSCGLCPETLGKLDVCFRLSFLHWRNHSPRGSQ